MLLRMSKKAVTRRSFMGAVSAIPAVAATRVPIVVPQVLVADLQMSQDPLKIVTTYKFEPHEVAKIKAVNPKVPIDVVICATPAEFREKVKDAEVVFGDLDAESLRVAAKVKWLQSGEAGVERLDPALRG